MSDLLSIGVSALLAYRKALDTAGHNIANVSTPGYSRQRVELQSRLGDGFGDGYIGAGVSAATVRRLNDAFIGQRLTADNAAFGRADALAGIAGTLDTWFSDPATGLSQPLQGFFDGLNALSDDPTSTAARQTVLSNAETLASRFRTLQGRLDNMQDELNGHIRQDVSDINSAARDIADLNQRIATARAAAGGQPPNDLLDQRDQLIQNLSGKIGISTVEADDGSISVFTGSGQSLVLGNQASAFGVSGDEFGSGRLVVTYGGTDVTAQIGGGSLGGTLDARRQVLDPARAQLGKLAAGLALTVNAQHARGVDANGDLGGNLFTPPSGTVHPAASNTGSATVGVGIADASQLTGGEYEMRYNGSQWQLLNRADGSSVPMTGSGTAADPFRAAGITLTVSGTANAGDRFLVQPTSDAAGGLRVAITDPAKVAAASPLKSAANVANTGSGAIGPVGIDDPSNPAFLSPVEIAFTGPGTYSINGSGSYPYTEGQPISVNGWNVTLTGAPAAGDRFTVSPAGPGSSDNGNARALGGLSGVGVFDGGRDSLGAAQAGLVSRIGGQAQQASIQRDAQQALLAQSTAQRDSVSGVNLDEEASDLVRFQQAYQAAAQVIQVADTVFQSLLNAARG